MKNMRTSVPIYRFMKPLSGAVKDIQEDAFWVSLDYILGMETELEAVSCVTVDWDGRLGDTQRALHPAQ